MMRAWLGLWIVLMLFATYVAGWAFFASMHQHSVNVQQPAGAAVVTDKGVRLRILDMHQSRTVPGGFDKVDEAAPGATFILVDFEATVPEPGTFCHLTLAGRGGKSWEYKPMVGKDISYGCNDDFEPGKPTAATILYEVPQVEAAHLMGVQVDYDRDAFFRRIVIRPGGPS